MKLSIQKALLPDAMPIARLLDEVTVQLHQKGILQWEHPWDPDKIGQDILLERVWACRDGKELVGTFSLRPLQTALWLDRRAKPDGQWYLYRVALRPSCQGAAWAQTSSVLPAVWRPCAKGSLFGLLGGKSRSAPLLFFGKF